MCEQNISVYEKYAREVLYGGVEITIQNRRNNTLLLNVDYWKMKLFQLSVLWRVGVSTQPDYSNVFLGPHEDRIRRMILAGDPGKYTDYGCVMVALLDDEKKLMHEAIFTPDAYRSHGHTCYRLVFAGCVWGYVVSSHNYPSNHLFLQENGDMAIGLTLAGSTPMMQDFARKLKVAGKLG